MPYFDLKSGVLHLDAEVTYDGAVSFLAVLREMERCDNVQSITVHILSHGGTLMPSIAIVQALLTCTKDVATIGSGYVASASLPILAAGKPGQRSILAGTKLLIHQPTHTFGETSKKSPHIEGWKHEVSFHEEITEQYYWALEQVSQRNATFWKEFLDQKPHRLITADEAIRYGLIDSVTDLRSHQTVTSAPV